ncbi:hypothetical protein MPH_02912 [Macrophomina phaseolina MS6]|uniref:Uncharacterized protein n=1 Tax=Macrophomina phaseolina (strain MS6) TaxID=1126212 RepID=K2RB75_MACPH|nr:hypothetical protein MPH_02912 [Macrophomina phaseolina MS6]
MSYFIFPAQTISHGLRPRNTYASILTDVVRASADSIDALLLFRKLLLGEGNASDDVGFTAYDAHVGDTSCQLRAAMVLDLFKHHRRYAARASPAWIDQVVEKLQDVQNKARKTLAQLTIERVHPSKLGIGARQDTPEDILKALGWSELDLPCDAGALYPGSQTRTQEARPTISKRRTSSHSAPRALLDKAAARLQHDTQHMFGPGLHHSDKLKNAHAGAQSHLATGPAGSSRTYSTTSPLLGESEPGAAWNPFDVRIITRFLVYSYVLSKYKSFRRFKHVVGARLYPEAAIGYGDGLVEEVIDKKTPDYKHSKATRRVEVEFAALQTWVSELSCAWLQATATHSNAAPYAQR